LRVDRAGSAQDSKTVLTCDVARHINIVRNAGGSQNVTNDEACPALLLAAGCDVLLSPKA
jgi:hypothetical protein